MGQPASGLRLWPWVVALALLSVSGRAQAYSAAGYSRRIVPSRWMLCREKPPRRQRVKPVAQSPTGDRLEAVPLRSRPSRHQAIPDRADEVAVYDPVPTGPERPEVALQNETVVIVPASRHSFKCLGSPRGMAGILRVIGAPSGARAYEKAFSDGWIRENIAAASILGISAAIKPLRLRLARPIPPPDPGRYHYQYEKIRSEAAIALSDLGDRASAPKIAAVLRATEGSPNTGWSHVMRGLGRLDPKAAETYAIGFFKRLANRKRKFVYRRESDSLVALDYLTAARRDEVVGALRKLTANFDDFEQDVDKHGFCKITAARARIGEEPFRSEARRKLQPDVRDLHATWCYSEWFEASFGYGPEDVDAVLRRGRYEGINELIDRLLRSESTADQAALALIKTAKKKLLDGLRKTSSSPRISDPTRRAYHLSARVAHFAALAALGDKQAVLTLFGHIDDPKDRSDAAWDGAYWAVRLGVPGAIEHALGRIRSDLKSYRNIRGWLRFTGWTTDDARVRLLDELVRRMGASDPRWAMALLNKGGDIQEKALFHLSRLEPAGACEVVAGAVDHAAREGVDGAFWALSVLGKACEKTMLRLARDGSQTKVVRGMAVELLAMMRSPNAQKLIRVAAGRKDVRFYAARARVINLSPE